MDEVKKNIERIEKRMAQSQVAVQATLTAQGAALDHIHEAQKSLAEGHKSLVEGQKRLAEAVRRLEESVVEQGRALEQHERAMEQNGMALRDLQRSNSNLREAFTSYRTDTDQMFGQLKAALFILESSHEMRFQGIEKRLDELERRPPAA